MISITGINLRPFVVNEYSTREGTSGEISRLINPSASNSRNCFLRNPCDISHKKALISL